MGLPPSQSATCHHLSGLPVHEQTAIELPPVVISSCSLCADEIRLLLDLGNSPGFGGLKDSWLCHLPACDFWGIHLRLLGTELVKIGRVTGDGEGERLLSIQRTCLWLLRSPGKLASAGPGGACYESLSLIQARSRLLPDPAIWMGPRPSALSSHHGAHSPAFPL